MGYFSRSSDPGGVCLMQFLHCHAINSNRSIRSTYVPTTSLHRHAARTLLEASLTGVEMPISEGISI